jgi:rhodanese-related sulfurtransferase
MSPNQTTSLKKNFLNGIDVDFVRTNVEAIAANPAAGQTRWSVTTRWAGGTRSETSVQSCSIGGQTIAKDFKIGMDEPLELGGTNRNANPQEYLLAALNACMTVGYVAACSLEGIEGDNAPAVIFHCQSGKRTADNAMQLRTCGIPELNVLEGGLTGWKSAGLATRVDRTQPIEIQRQVQIAAGSLVLAGLALAYLVSPWFLALSAFVGTGLVFAGVSGWCGMAKVLGVMPWNRVAP